MRAEAPRYLALPSVDDLVFIYRFSMEIRLQADRLLTQALRLGRLAINTQIVAIKSVRGGRAFTVIAREVSSLAAHITEEISGLSQSGHRLSSSAVEGAARARLCEKYLQALDLGVAQGSSQDRVRMVREHAGRELLRVLLVLRDQLKQANKSAGNLTRLSVHLPVVATLFRIEASRTDKHNGSIFRGMGDELIKYNDRLQKDLEKLLLLAGKTLETCNHLVGG